MREDKQNYKLTIGIQTLLEASVCLYLMMLVVRR